MSEAIQDAADKSSAAGGWIDALQIRFSLLDDPGQPELLRSTEALMLLHAMCDALESGSLQMVQGNAAEGWRANGWARRALYLLSRAGQVQAQPGALPGSELDTLGWSESRPLDRRIPAGSMIRRGAYVAAGATVMPPSTVQAGAAILPGAVIDSHTLVGSGVLVCEGAMVGCGTMLGGSLMPADAVPVILERGVVVGGNCGLYGSVLVGEGTAIYAGTTIRSAAGAFHETRREWILPGEDGALRLPPRSTVCMGVPPAEYFPARIQRLVPVIAD